MRFYVTTPIYYVNDVPHIGHAYTTIAADIVARHRRQRGDETFFLTGVDEHGTKVRQVADREGVSPQEYVDRISVAWRELSGRVEAEPDFFIRTSDAQHAEFVRDFLQRHVRQRRRLRGRLRRALLRRLRGVQARIASSSTASVPTTATPCSTSRRRTTSFGCPRTRSACSRLYEERPDLVLPRFRYERGAKLYRGRPAGLLDQPGRRDVGHPAAVGREPGRLRLGGRARQLPERADLRAAGRGSPCRFWPRGAPRHGQGHPALPLRVLAGDVAVRRVRRAEADLRPRVSLARRAQDVEVARQRDQPARSRRRLRRRRASASGRIRSVSFGQDGSVSLDSLHERYERELGNELGNLLSRTTAMIARYRRRRGVGRRLRRAQGRALGARHRGRSPHGRLGPDRRARDRLGRRPALNAHVEETKPWELARDGPGRPRSTRCSSISSTGCRSVAVALAAFVPRSAESILVALGQPHDLRWEQVAPGKTTPAAGIQPAAPLFPRIDAPAAA